MNRWDDLVGQPRAAALRDLLCRAAEVAHTENGARFDPEDLGDDALIYGLCTTHNARHVAARLVEDAELAGVTVHERGRVWWLEVQRAEGPIVRVYFYKAPPGERNVQGLRLDDAEIKKQLSTSNGLQLVLFNRNGGQGNAQLLNLIVVHYGDPIAGLEKVDVGAPYVLNDEIGWSWDERFDSAAISAPRASWSLHEDNSGFEGLRLVSNARQEESVEEEPEPATSEFEALGLRDQSEADDTDADTDQETS